MISIIMKRRCRCCCRGGWLGGLPSCLVPARTQRLGSASAHDAHRNTAANQRGRANTTPVVQSAATRALAGWPRAPQASPASVQHRGVALRFARGAPCLRGRTRRAALPILRRARCTTPSVSADGFSVGCGRATPPIGQPARRLDGPALHSVPPARPARAQPDPCLAARSVSVERLRRPHRRTANHPLRGLVIAALDLQSDSRTSWRPSPGCSDHSTPP